MIIGCFTPPPPAAPARAYAPQDWAEATWPLGAHPDLTTDRCTFAVYAPAATRVLLELYATAGSNDAIAEFELARGSDGIWRGELDPVPEHQLYAFRCWGPNWPHDPQWCRGGSAAGFVADVDADGNRFNPNKVLFDPYAREITHNLLAAEIFEAGGDGGAFGTGGGEWHGQVRRTVDTGRFAPKGIVLHDRSSFGVRPRIAPADAAIYEAHVRSLTKHPSALRLHDLLGGALPGLDLPDIPEQYRGTYRGAALWAPYLKALGFTTIEFLPIHETNNEANAQGPDDAPGSGNFWGYQTLAYFAPNRSYSSDQSRGGPTREFKEMMTAFHEQGLEVYLDVVYNHSAEGGHWNNDLDTVGFVSLGGFAVNDYYQQTDEHRLIDGATGTSNQLNMSTAVSQNLVLDSLRYWIEEMGVDGFRFDLAPVLGRTPNAFERENWDEQRQFFHSHPLLEAIHELADADQVEVIAEAWDLWGYEVGNFPAGWGEWNGRYRDAMRGYLKGDANTDTFISMFNGDYANFNDQGGPQKSINFVTAHDGFTMADLVSYNTKVNDGPWPFGPSDGGSDDNLSWDSGGDHALRRTRIRNFWTVLFLSRGVPMVVSGDEYGRTQNGNNNPWCLDTVGMWNNWAQAGSATPDREQVDPEHPEVAYHDNLGESPTGANAVFTFAHYMACLRRDHPALRQHRYGNMELDDDDVSYLFYTPDGKGHPAPRDRCVRIYIDGSGVGDTDFVLLVNMWTQPTSFVVSPDRRWHRIIDTSANAEEGGNALATEDGPEVRDNYVVNPWSIAVLQEWVPRD
ncbi:alpha-amylase family glycosyl hydrolase [Granulicoccus phenolivorans]|uniref:alpha-amylase family glycosyl hydrolase n=1 Tax=Granulicoccus phenolivorans TaxID=266854 RepID=UPI001B7F9E6E|nr:alpha-amylase family glycosyl hydrolase [Granulicoccus phenolivorans]